MNTVNKIVENLNESQRLNEYAEVKIKSNNLKQVIVKAIKDSVNRPENLIKNLFNETSNYAYGDKLDQFDSKKNSEVEEFWLSVENAIESGNNGYF